MNKSIKNLCIDCKLAQKEKEKDKHLCSQCARKRLIESFHDIRIDVPESKYF